MKRKLQDEEISQSESEYENESISSTADDDQIDVIIDVSFAFSSPKESDFFALKKLISPLMPNCEELSELVDTLISSNIAAIAVYIDHEENDDNDNNNDGEDKEIPDPVSISALVEMKKSVAAYLNQNLKHETNASKLFLNTRLINIPFDIIPPSFNILMNDIHANTKEYSKKDEKIGYLARMYCMNGKWEYYQMEDEIIAKLALRTLNLKSGSNKADAVFYDQEIQVKTVYMEVLHSSLLQYLNDIQVVE